jgi:hypothetical protein
MLTSITSTVRLTAGTGSILDGVQGNNRETEARIVERVIYKGTGME